MEYDGVPLNGSIHAWNEPPDVPLAWRGAWSERFAASGTRLNLAAPTPSGDRARSQVSMTTGSWDRRTSEFALFRGLGPVLLGVNFMDREQGIDPLETALLDVKTFDHNRLWVHLESAGNRRPDWSLDISGGTREHKLSGGGRLAQNARRLQASFTGPTLGGETRIALQLRRQAERAQGGTAATEELLWDGWTLQGDWAMPGGRGLYARLRWDRDRRRGILDAPRTLDGVRGTLIAARERGPWRLGAEATVGHQEPWGGTVEGLAAVTLAGQRGSLRASLSREENAPPLLDVLDRPVPETGLVEFLELYESSRDPEIVQAFRLEASWKEGGLDVRLGAWLADQRNYRIEANPLWAESVASGYTPVVRPDAHDRIAGLYGSARLPLGRGLAASGRGRIQDRRLDQAPYMASWVATGGIHWRHLWFQESLDLDVELGGDAVGPRRNPGGERYPVSSRAHLRASGMVDNGRITFAVENLTNSRLEADFRRTDTVTPLPVAGRHYVIGLTMTLFD